MSSHRVHISQSRAGNQRISESAVSLIGRLYWAGVLFWGVAILVRLTVRDLSPFSFVTVLYYASPGVLLFLSAGFLMLFAAVLRKYRLAATWYMLAIVVAQCAGSNYPSSGQISTVQQPDKTYRLLLWNVSHGRRGWENIAEEINDSQADIIALVEAGTPSEQMRTFWKEHFPGYDISLLGGEMVLLTRGKSTAVRARKIGRQGQVREVDLILDGHAITTMIVDIHGRPDIPRGESLEDLAELLISHQGRPVLIAGDFNTPSESPLFQPLRQQSSNAFEVSGNGYSPTWPRPFPVLVIDQIWGSHQVAFDSCKNIWSKASDHCAVVTDFYFEK